MKIKTTWKERSAIEHIRSDQKNYLVIQQGYQQQVVNKIISLHLKSLDKTKTAGPEKC